MRFLSDLARSELWKNGGKAYKDKRQQEMVGWLESFIMWNINQCVYELFLETFYWENDKTINTVDSFLYFQRKLS